MSSAGNYIDTFDYTELSNNYDAIYETLVDGGVVWLKVNFANVYGGDLADLDVGTDGYLHFMVTAWYMNYDGLNIVCPDGGVLIFTNGSYTPVSEK